VLLDLLQDQLSELRKENVRLRRVVAERIPSQAPQILASCTTVESGLLAASDAENDDNDEDGAQNDDGDHGDDN
jgi:hypothetical protein